MGSYSNQKGQVLLIVVLAMVVALTVGLSIASRIVTELKVSKQNEESQRAFQAAEAGIQQQLKSTLSSLPSQFLGNNASFSTVRDLTGLQGTSISINSGIEVDQDAGADVWLSNYVDDPDPGNNYQTPMSCGAAACSSGIPVYVYWGEPGSGPADIQNDCTDGASGPNVGPAIEVVILYDKSNPKIMKYVIDCGTTRIPGSELAEIAPAGTPFNDSGISGNNFLYRKEIRIPNGNALVMKVIPIFNSTSIDLKSNAAGVDFPKQGSVVLSTGSSGDTERKIKYYTSLPQLPIEVFPYSIISQ